MIYDPAQPGDLFELLDDGRIQCKACAEIVPDQQIALNNHANEQKETAGKKGSCEGFWRGSR